MRPSYLSNRCLLSTMARLPQDWSRSSLQSLQSKLVETIGHSLATSGMAKMPMMSGKLPAGTPPPLDQLLDGVLVLTTLSPSSYIPYSHAVLTNASALSDLDPFRNISLSVSNDLPPHYANRTQYSAAFETVESRKVNAKQIEFMRGKHIGLLGSS